MRADAGGRAASPGRIRAAHRASLANLPEALREFGSVWVYDNTPLGNPRLVLETERAKIRTVAEHPPSWLRQALKSTRELSRARRTNMALSRMATFQSESEQDAADHLEIIRGKGISQQVFRNHLKYDAEIVSVPLGLVYQGTNPRLQVPAWRKARL